MSTKIEKMLGSLESDQDLNTTDNVIFNSLSTYNLSLEEYSQSVSNFLNDAGCITHPVLTDNGDGTATISSTEVALYDSDNSSGTLTKYVLDEVTLTFVDGEEEYVVADYNEGSPLIRKETDKTLINCSDVCSMMICWRQGTTIHSVDQDSSALGLASKIHRSLYNTEPYKRSVDGGLSLSETSTPADRTITLTSSTVYAGALKIDVESFDSSINSLMEAISTDGVWSYSEKSVYDNTYYNSTSGLVEATNTNKYLIRWFYRSIGDAIQMFYTLGEDEYSNLASAEDATIPSIPILLRDHCMLVGRIIIQKNASSGIIESAFDNIFVGSLAVSHNDTTNIQGGETDAYYHSNQEINDTDSPTFAGLTIGDDTNYSEFESDGTLEFNGTATTWDDVVGSLIGRRLSSTAGGVDYNWSENSITFNSGGSVTDDSDVVNINQQYPHKARLGTGAVIYPHIHWWQPDDTAYVFSLQYRIQDNGAIKTETWTTITATAGTDDVFTYPGTGTFNNILTFPSIDVSTISISSTIQFRLARTDSLGGTVDVTFFDFHAEVNTMGSREQYIK